MFKNHSAYKQLLLLVIVGLVVFSVACEKSEAQQPPTTESPTQKTDTPSKGTKHDPPIQASAVPAAHWYCDMGTVHYSQATAGDGKCPLCGMKLVEKSEGSETKKEDHAGHKH